MEPTHSQIDCIQTLSCMQVKKLHEFQWVTEQQQILTEQNLQQVLQQSAELQNQLDQSQSTRKKSNIEVQQQLLLKCLLD